ncbi:MAG: hypothetical protein LCH52_03785 [Bacteroidetes bacterium]|nr:hypothetical protein [Bacteroidota bacterium]
MYFREELYNSISGSLKSITTGSGYATNIGNYINEYQSDVANESEIQVYILDKFQNFEDTGNFSLVYPVDGSVSFDIIIQIRKGTDTLRYLRNAVLDVEKMIGNNYETLRTLYPSIRFFISGNEITIEREEKIIGTGNINLTAYFRQKSFDPDTHC